MRGFFSWRKADDAGVLSPGKKDNAAPQKKDRKDKCIFELINYIVTLYYGRRCSRHRFIL